MAAGNIVYLNGTSSAGKSSLAAALQATLPDPYLHFSLDRFTPMFPARYVAVQSFADTIPALARGGLVLRHELAGEQLHLDTRIGPAGRRFFAGMRRCIRALAETGNHVIVDDVLFGREFIAECVAALDGLPVLLIEVYCPLPEVARRERERGDRLLGLTAWQLPRIRAGLWTPSCRAWEGWGPWVTCAVSFTRSSPSHLVTPWPRGATRCWRANSGSSGKNGRGEARLPCGTATTPTASGAPCSSCARVARHWRGAAGGSGWLGARWGSRRSRTCAGTTSKPTPR